MSEQMVKRSFFGHIGHPVYECCQYYIHGTKDMDTHFKNKHGADTSEKVANEWLAHEFKSLPYCFKLMKYCRTPPAIRRKEK
jgi:hypothetical protein